MHSIANEEGMMKRNVLYIFFLFSGSTSLFSSPRSESFLIINLSNEELLIDYQYHDHVFDGERITISDFDVFIRYTTPERDTTPVSTWLLKPDRYIGMIYYVPVFNLNENSIDYFYDRLLEIPFSEKAKAFFKSFSIYTAAGECIIRDINELCTANVRQDRLGYRLVFFDPDKYHTDEELEQAINAVLRPGGS